MLTRDKIAERLAESEHECFPPPSWGMYCEALETAQKLGEWVANADHGQDAVELLKARAWLRGEGE